MNSNSQKGKFGGRARHSVRAVVGLAGVAMHELRGAGIKIGYLINFGRERVEYKRMVV